MAAMCRPDQATDSPIGKSQSQISGTASGGPISETFLVPRSFPGDSVTKQSKKRILLIHPPFYRLFSDSFSYDRFPLSLGYLAGSIKRETDWDVLVFNADFNPNNRSGNFDVTFGFRAGAGFQNYLSNLRDLSAPIWKVVKKTIKEYSPDVIGISAMTPNFASACIIARLARESNREIIVVVGGPHPSVAGKSVFDCPSIDIAVKGEGEKTIAELLKALESHQHLQSVNGILYRKDGQIMENAPRQYMQELETLCFPHEIAPDVLKDYNSFPLRSFNNVFANRGCPYDCAFCASRHVWSRHVRLRPVWHVVKEIKGLQDKGVRSIYFCDDTFGANRLWTEELCYSLIESCPGLRWSCETHAKSINDESLSLMKKAGCYKIELGIESGNNEILEKMRKKVTIEKALNAAEKIRNHGIELHAYFLAGFPFETENTLSDTLRAIRGLKCHIAFSTFTPYPGTEMYEYCEKNGLLGANYDPALHNHQSLDCFTPHIPEDRFKELVRKIQKVVDRKNSLYRARRIFSLNTLWRVRELGLLNSIKKGAKVFLTK